MVNFHMQTVLTTMTINTTKTNEYLRNYSGGGQYLNVYIKIDIEENKISIREGGSTSAWKGEKINYLDEIIGIKL